MPHLSILAFVYKVRNKHSTACCHEYFTSKCFSFTVRLVIYKIKKLKDAKSFLVLAVDGPAFLMGLPNAKVFL